MDIIYPIQNQEVNYFHINEFSNKNSKKYLAIFKFDSRCKIINNESI